MKPILFVALLSALLLNLRPGGDGLAHSGEQSVPRLPAGASVPFVDGDCGRLEYAASRAVYLPYPASIRLSPSRVNTLRHRPASMSACRISIVRRRGTSTWF